MSPWFFGVNLADPAVRTATAGLNGHGFRITGPVAVQRAAWAVLRCLLLLGRPAYFPLPARGVVARTQIYDVAKTRPGDAVST